MTQAKRSRAKSVAGMMGRGFLKRLDAGVMIDRNRVHSDGKSRYKIDAPSVLLKARPMPLNRAGDLLPGSQPAPLGSTPRGGRTTWKGTSCA
jgi:hypothetical protein